MSLLKFSDLCSVILMTYFGFINMEPTSQYSDNLTQRLSLNNLVDYTDANNNDKSNINSRADKYSLRPRSLRRCGVTVDEEDAPLPTTSKSRVSKPKQKPAPLSKYRRKTANARERSRMREINAAFEALRSAIPHLQSTGLPSTTANEKLTKITTLRLAMKYISALSSVLRDTSSTMGMPQGSDLGDLISDCSDLDCLFLESDGESMHLQSDLSDHSLTPDMSEHCLTPVNLSVDFGEQFGDHSLSPTFPDETLSPFDSLFPDFS